MTTMPTWAAALLSVGAVGLSPLVAWWAVRSERRTAKEHAAAAVLTEHGSYFRWACEQAASTEDISQVVGLALLTEMLDSDRLGIEERRQVVTVLEAVLRELTPGYPEDPGAASQ